MTKRVLFCPIASTLSFLPLTFKEVNYIYVRCLDPQNECARKHTRLEALPETKSAMAAFYTFHDLSGSTIQSTSDNPYEGLIEACRNDPVCAASTRDIGP